MNDRLVLLLEDDEPMPATRRASADDLAMLVAQSLPPPDRSEELTPFSGEPSIDLIAMALGVEDDAMALMRSLYVAGDTERALAIAAEVDSVVRADPFAEIDRAW